MLLSWMWIKWTAALLALQRATALPGRRSRAERERRRARTIARTLRRLGGLYTELGRHLALRPELPEAARAEFARLRGDASGRPFHEIRVQLRASLGPAARRFSWIDPVPASATPLRQEHRAKLADGALVNIWLRDPSFDPARIRRAPRTLRGAARLLRPWLRRGERRALLEDLGRSLCDEFDFEKDAQVSSALAASFADDPHILVPEVHREVSTPDVLTLDQVPWIRLEDRLGLARLGIAPEECQALICEAYGRQVVEHGRFHADPGPGNLFVVDEDDPRAPEGGGRPRIVFMDFGLALRLPDELRHDLREALLALRANDVPALLGVLERIGALADGRRQRTERTLREALDNGAGDSLGCENASIEPLLRVARQLVLEQGALRAPEELLPWVRTMTYVLALARSVAPDSDPVPHLLPHLHRFLASAA